MGRISVPDSRELGEVSSARTGDAGQSGISGPLKSVTIATSRILFARIAAEFITDLSGLEAISWML